MKIRESVVLLVFHVDLGLSICSQFGLDVLVGHRFNLRDEISHIRKVIDKANNIWSIFEQCLIRKQTIYLIILTPGSDLEPIWSGLQGAQPRNVHKVGATSDHFQATTFFLEQIYPRTKIF